MFPAPSDQAAPNFSTNSLSLNTPAAIQATANAKSPIPMGSIPTANPVPVPAPTMNAAAIQSNQGQTTQFPTTAPNPQTAASSAISANASIPSLTSITSQETAQTPAEKTNQTFLQKVATLVGQGKGQQDFTNEAENAAGVPALTKTVNDLNTQLQGLNDQATSLQNEQNYTIPNQVQLDNQGSGVTKASTAARSADSLRTNQIKQGQVATQALTLKAAIYGAQGSLTLAKDAADKAATAQYEHQQQQIDYMNALIKANEPQMTKEEKAQADTVKAQLDERQRLLDNAKEDKQTAIALATAALKNNPSDPQAQYAAQQALQESNQEQPDLSKIFSLVGKYQTDPMATQKALLDLQLTRSQIAASNANTAKTQAETRGLSTSNESQNVTLTTDTGSLSVPVGVAPYVSTSHSGIAYADLSTVQGTAAEKKAIVDQAQAAGIKVITNKNTALDLTNIEDANSKLDSISTIMAGIAQPGALSRGLYGLGLTKFATLAQSNPQQAASGALQGVGLDILKAISGVQGFRGNSSVVQQITDHLPSIYDTTDVVNTKVSYIRQLIADREDSILDQQGTNANTNVNNTTTKSGKPFDYAGAKSAGNSDADIKAYLATH